MWVVCALWALWGPRPLSVIHSNSLTHSANTYAARVLCQVLGIKQNNVPCPFGADILTERTTGSSEHTNKEMTGMLAGEMCCGNSIKSRAG